MLFFYRTIPKDRISEFLDVFQEFETYYGEMKQIMQITNANTSNVFFGNIPQNSGLKSSKDVATDIIRITWMFRLIREISTFKGLVFLLFGLWIYSAVLNIIPPLLLQFAIDNYILKGNEMGLLIILIALIGLGALIAIQSYLQRQLSQYIGFNVIKNLRNELFEHISRLPFEFFESNNHRRCSCSGLPAIRIN